MADSKIELAKIIDHTGLRGDLTSQDIQKLCDEAIKYGFRAVCVNPIWVKFCRENLPKNILVASVIDFPLGASGLKNKIFQSQKAKDDGANELDIVINIGALKEKNDDLVLKELENFCKILPTKVIIESGYLLDEEIKKAAKIVEKSGAFMIKTSTGYFANTSIEEKIRHIKIIKETIPVLKIKASGGIKTLADAKAVISAGADIIGTSSGVNIIQEIRN